MDLKIKDVAELLNISETTIRRWLAEGKIPAYRLNHQFRFNRNEIEDWVLSCKMRNEKQEPQAEKVVGTQQFSLYRAIHKGIVLETMTGETKEEVIHNSMQKIAAELNLDAEAITTMLLDRERMMPTALNHGIGVPHTRDFLLRQPYDVISVVFPQKPIPYGSLDGQPVHSLFFLFACEDKRHLHLLAKLAHLASNKEALLFLQTKPNKAALLDYIKNWEATL